MAESSASAIFRTRGSGNRWGARITRGLLYAGLITGAGLMVASVVRLLRVEPGYDPVNLAVVAPDFTGRNSPTKEQRNAFIEQLRARLAALPGVVAVGVFKDNYREERFTVEWNRADDSVWYDLWSFSRPGHPLARLAGPYVRRLQRRFAEDSLRAMAEACRGGL